MSETKVFNVPDGNNSINPALMLALSQSGGFGNGMNWMWPMFLFFMFPWLFNGGFGGGFGGFGGGNGTGFLANQLNNDAGRDLLLQAINGRADSLSQLAGILNTSVSNVLNGINSIQTAIQSVGSQVGLTGAQVINSIQNGNASLSQQLCQCCCENRLAVVELTNQLQSLAAANHADATLLASQNYANQQLLSAQNHAATQLQLAQSEAADQLAVCQQTNTLATQAERNTNSIVNAIANQSSMITKEFCDLKERELLNKIDALVADNAILRSNAATTAQTQQFAAMLGPINAELAAIKAAQPSTITLPNSQYAVVPSWAANVGADFVASYWASRLNSAVGNTTTTTPAA